MMLRTIAPLVAIAQLGTAALGSVIWQEAESFAQTGGWSNDSQHVDIMGSPYLLATGVGRPVEDAVTSVPVDEPGTYRLWVRCRDWHPEHSPGTFKIAVGGQYSNVTFGAADDDNWRWVDGGEFELAAGSLELRLRDESGWWGRCDAVVLASGAFRPADEAEPLVEQRLRYGGVSEGITRRGPFDLVVVGAGSSGLGAALAAARNGIKVALIQDRPVVGGNGSSEIQVPPMGNIGKPPDQVNVTGIAEEIYPIQGWANFADSDFIAEIVAAEENISLFLNTRANGVEMADTDTIAAVLAFDVRSGERFRIEAPLFIDTTGHGWIGFYAGAEYRMGTEARSEFGETMAPLEATPHTMGNSLYKAVFEDTDKPEPFECPPWAYKWEKPDDFERVLPRIKKAIRPPAFDGATRGKGRAIPDGIGADRAGSGLAGAYKWFVEIGGLSDTVEDAEQIRDDLFRIHVGLWNYAKNHNPATVEFCETRRMAWLNYVPGVRESRRLLGDYIMTQKDFDDSVEHADNVAFTDWGIDDHHPQGFWVRGIDVMHVYHGRRVSIPYRSLYSKNIDNLFMAGRCMSVSHLALGGVRVQRPMCATGQVVGTAAAIATRHGRLPRDIYESHIAELQQQLLRDGCYIVGVKNEDPKDLARAANTSSPAIINGWNRESRGLPNGADWRQPITLEWNRPASFREIHLTLDKVEFAASFAVEHPSGDGWQALVEKQVAPGSLERRMVFTVPSTTTEKLRFRLIESDKPLRICEVRVYEYSR